MDSVPCIIVDVESADGFGDFSHVDVAADDDDGGGQAVCAEDQVEEALSGERILGPGFLHQLVIGQYLDAGTQNNQIHWKQGRTNQINLNKNKQ